MSMADFPVPRRPNRARRLSYLSDVTTSSGSGSGSLSHPHATPERSDLERLKDYIASVQRTNEALILQIWESVLVAGEETSRTPPPHNIPLPSSRTSSPTRLCQQQPPPNLFLPGFIHLPEHSQATAAQRRRYIQRQLRRMAERQRPIRTDTSQTALDLDTGNIDNELLNNIYGPYLNPHTHLPESLSERSNRLAESARQFAAEAKSRREKEDRRFLLTCTSVIGLVGVGLAVYWKWRRL